MVKKGPCFHCGINSTPLWRNGPAEKPVLCNACGSRYKLKGHLENYLPKNVQHHLYLDNINKNIDGRSQGKLSNHVPAGAGGVNPNLWKKIPSRKRSPVVHKRMTPIERFGKQLLSLFRCQRQPEEVSLVHNMNNFIPKNEIGVGVTLLKMDVASIDPESITCSESSTSAT